MRLVAASWVLFTSLALFAAAPLGVTDPDGKPQDPFAAGAKARVFLFVRTDCPLTNRYAPELQRVAAEFAGRGVEFWLVYPDSAENASGIRRHLAEYKYPGTPLRDPRRDLVRRAQADVAPEAAVFDAADRLVYTGRIDDRFVDFGKERPAPRTHDLEAAISATLAGKPVEPSKTRAVGCFLADLN